jgi:hypothetical protein
MLWGHIDYPVGASADYETNLRNLNNLNVSPVPQSIIVDTTAMTAGSVTIVWDKGNINYRFAVPWGVKDVFTVPAVSCTYGVTMSADAAAPAGSNVRIDLVNFPMLPQSYNVQNAESKDSVSVNNFPATQAVSGTVDVGNFPATQQVSGSVDVGNFPATQAVSGSIGVSNFPATQTTQPSSGAVTDYSGGIAVANTSQQLCPAVTNRKFFYFINISGSKLWIDFGVDAVETSPSIPAYVGTPIVFDGGFVPNDVINIIGGTQGAGFVCKTA